MIKKIYILLNIKFAVTSNETEEGNLKTRIEWFWKVKKSKSKSNQPKQKSRAKTII